jgi:hypothetical protein
MMTIRKDKGPANPLTEYAGYDKLTVRIMENVSQCPHCGGTNITGGVWADQTAGAGAVGLAYKTKFVIMGVERLYADICNDCGTVVRFFVKNPSRQWYTK